MNGLPEPLQQLVDRKLWPIALLLVALLVALPMVLKDDSDTTPLPVPTATTTTAAAESDSIVTVADADKVDKVRAVLGDRKDPFRPAQVHHVKKADSGATTTAANGATTINAGGGTDSTSGGTDAGGTTTTPAPTAPTPTPTPKPTFDLYSLTVRFGSTDGDLVTRNVKRLTGLPGGEHPAALYLGLLDDHKSAVFIIDAGVQALGDGHCDPKPEDCQTLTLKKGETEFLTRGTKQWELDLVDIHLKKTTNAKAAKASRAVIASDGRRKLKGLVSRVGALRYDEGKGSLRKLPKAEQAKRVAKFNRSAAFTPTG